MRYVRMISIAFQTLAFSLLSVSCSRHDASSPEQGLMRDSLLLVDSSDQSAAPWAGEAMSYEQRQGKNIYMKYCAICHGKEGKGDGFNAFNLDPRPRDFTDRKYMSALGDGRLLETISQGGRGVNRSPFMPSWRGRLNNAEIKYVASYVGRLSRADEQPVK